VDGFVAALLAMTAEQLTGPDLRQGNDSKAGARQNHRTCPPGCLSMRRLVLAFALAALPSAAFAADPANGLVIAKRWCAECHVVAADQASAKADVPSFADIAKRRVPEAGGGLQKFLMDPHPKMPDMQINRREADDLVAYIATLKTD
jgi:mono/diheme cytochrome c family protein